ncbi:hypothetical protein [Rubellicoccus peritrichatus]|uniref:Uncharacterized protein n=1 Tax=Rubellicoccus peritrichatus TaxID=3080537 RepID=A0AAQ3QRV1_9BACT|nr:hypothetical protein [Puniceicoccus sp. CR14]WOO39661.1 hypothetical protein RZN69_13640 [Puniceicoccus sp. CR14]
MIGISLLAIAATVSIIGVLKDNKPKEDEKAILGLNRTGFALLVLAILAFGLGFTKNIFDSIDSAKNQSELITRLDNAEKERDTAKAQRDDLKLEVQESRRYIAQVKRDLSNAIELSTTGIQREIDHPVVRELKQEPKTVMSQVTRRPLTVKPGDEIHYFFYASLNSGLKGILHVGERTYRMQTDQQGRGSVRVVGFEGQELPVRIQAAPRTPPVGGIKMTVKSSYTQDIVTLVREALDESESAQSALTK